MIFKIYNIMAECIRFVLDSCIDEVYSSCNGLSKAYKQSIDIEINNAVKELCDVEGNIIEISTVKDLDHYVTDVNNIARTYIDNSEHKKLIRLINRLDQALEVYVDNISMNNMPQSLNNNHDETNISILPRVICKWENSSRGNNYYNRLDNFIKKHMFIDFKKLSGYKVENIFIDEIKVNDELNIALCPLKDEADLKLEYYSKNGEIKFNVKYNGNQKEDNELIKDKIVVAGEHECNIIMFPEMMGNTKTEQHIIRFLEEQQFEDNNIPDIIVLPSVWDKNTNIATVLNKYGEIICKQNKRNPFLHTIKEGEDVGSNISFIGEQANEGITKRKEISVIHCKGIGRIAIIICKDFLMSTECELLVRQLKLTLILVPSFSTGAHGFAYSDGIKKDDCCVVWLNTCAAMDEIEKFKNIGYIVKAGRHKNKDDEPRYSIECKKCLELRDCKRDCIYYESLKMNKFDELV